VALTVALLAVVFVPMLIEAQRAAVNEQFQREQGGVEAPGDVYQAMRIAYPLTFLAMIGEQAVRGSASAALVAAGLLVFVAAKALKWWAIVSLGGFWTFRVITRPGAALVTSGPYRFIRHPNYVAVVGELAGVALMSAAWVAGPVSVVLFGWLILKRIAIEERALQIVQTLSKG